ncbi:hypothetical protein KJ780_01130 [Candidatus Micrarchaeota archaeon]|nr:hypothetical protein [Candidatus Micrarchaeota archaeon]
MGLSNEEKRKIVHMVSGAIFIAVLFIFGRTDLIALLVCLLLGGMLIINSLLLKRPLPFVNWFIKHIERPNVRFPGYSTAWYVAGLLIAATILGNDYEIAAVMCALAFGDAFGALVGFKGKHRLPYNKEKNFESVLAFFFVTLFSSFFFIGWNALLFAGLMAVLESLPLRLDDNFSIPLIGAAFFILT